MSRSSIIIISLLLACFSAGSVIGQTFTATPPVTPLDTTPAPPPVVVPVHVDISTEKINLNGDLFFMHKVLRGQTLYSISRAYNVSIESIIKQNPSTEDGLKAWSIIFVPISDLLKNAEQKPASPQLSPTVNLPIILPPVSRQVTPPVIQQVSAVSEAEHVQQEVQHIQQEAQHIEQEVQHLQQEVEVADIEEEVVEVAEVVEEKKEDSISKKKKYRRHTVKWYETIEDIGDFYNVSVEGIIHLNDLEPNVVLKKRQKIYIPNKGYQIGTDDIDPEEEQVIEETPEGISYPSVGEATTEVEIIPIDENLYIHDYRTHKISLILPFNASQSTDKASTNQMDFYSGALMAIKDLQSKIHPFEYYINVVDLSSYSSVSQMLHSGAINDSELIIGPIVQKDIEPVAHYAKAHRIPIISPLDIKTEDLLTDNPYLFLFPSLPINSHENLINEFIETDPLDSIQSTIIFENGSEYSTIVTSAINSFNQKAIKYTPFSYGILEGRGIDTILCHILDSVHHNKVYIASESEAFVSDVLRNLNLLQSIDTFSINVYGSGRWRNFETLETDYLHKLNARFSLQYNIDYSDSLTRSFVKRYWEVFNAEPTPYSFQGYDITSYFLSALNEFGRTFPAYISNRRQKLLQSDVLFKPISIGSGFINEATRDVLYLDDWVISNW